MPDLIGSSTTRRGAFFSADSDFIDIRENQIPLHVMVDSNRVGNWGRLLMPDQGRTDVHASG
jgi:hypothetical protein